MKHTYAFLAVLVFATSTGSAQLIRLVAKQESSSGVIQVPHAEIGQNEQFINFFEAGSTGHPISYSGIIDVPEGEALRPLQINITDDETTGKDPTTFTEFNPTEPTPDQAGWNGQNAMNRAWDLVPTYARLEAKFPEIDKWFNVAYDSSSHKWSGFGSDKPIIYGPAKVRLYVAGGFFRYGNNFRPGYTNQYRSPTQKKGSDSRGATRKGYYQRSAIAWGMLEVINTFDNTQRANNITVLPNSASDLNLILESSDDLVNWTKEGLGKKPAGNRKRFYRLRAVKK